MQKIIPSLVLLMLGAVLASPAIGKIVTHSELVERLDNNYSGINSYLLVVTFDNPNISLRIWQKSENWRQEWVMDSGQGQEVVAVAVGQGDTVLLALGNDLASPPVTRILFENSTWWSKAGLDFGVQSYHFFHGRPALALGMKMAEDPEPHLWIDNEHLVPLRMVFSEQGAKSDLGWLEYRNIGNYNLPHKLIIANRNAEIDCYLEWKGINTQYDDLLFSRDELERSFFGADLNPPDLVMDYYIGQAGLYK